MKKIHIGSERKVCTYLRVIAGSAKKTKLKMPGGGKVRPTADRVKEALFNSLAPLVPGAKLLDLFAGSGALGIEALSRGGTFCVFVENDAQVAKTLRANLQRTKLLDKSKIIVRDVSKALVFLTRQRESFDLIFMDPPYGKNLEQSTLEKIADYDLLTAGGIAVVESRKDQVLPQYVRSLRKIRSAYYGDTMVTFYEKIIEEKEEEINCV